MTLSSAPSDGVGLGNRALLDKVDKLRELGISSQIPLPQIVAAGEQSAGKSSLLESLTGISFPRSVSLCTRFATEIICRREKEEGVVVTIQPGEGSSHAHAQNVRAFRRTISSFTGDAFAKVFKEATLAMGIKTEPQSESTAPTFTRDVLRIEKSGPNEDHLTLIDVPGIFENESPGLTTKNDILMVKEMVKAYIKDSRTIILAVVPCNTDIATQTIIRFASEVDPDGKRTLGVLTKPDLAVETATKNAVAELVGGRRRDLRLGYCVVRNRGADDHSTTINMDTRNAEESAFFSQEPWSKLEKSRVGIVALKGRLRELLMDRTKSEFPNVKREIAAHLHDARQQLETMGASRAEPDEQRAFLGRIASRFVDLVKYGLDAYYAGDPLFMRNKDLRLITRMRDLNDAFAALLFAKGHAMEFQSEEDKQEPSGDDASSCAGQAIEDELVDWSNSPTPASRGELYPLSFEIPSEGEADLEGILTDPFQCPDPASDSLIHRIESIHRSSRGYELGTFSSSMIPTTFGLQAAKWEPMALAHVSNAILVVHHFIHALVTEACPDDAVRDALWAFLLDGLMERYRRATDHARFLLQVELGGKAVTCIPDFDRALAEAENKRMTDHLEGAAVEIPDTVKGVRSGKYVRVDDVSRSSTGKLRTSAAVCEKIHDVTKSYYEVVRSRFVDSICAYAVDHFLLSGRDSPLRVFGPDCVFAMSTDQLEMIAGEDAATRSLRVTLKARIEVLERAVKILRG